MLYQKPDILSGTPDLRICHVNAKRFTSGIDIVVLIYSLDSVFKFHKISYLIDNETIARNRNFLLEVIQTKSNFIA